MNVSYEKMVLTVWEGDVGGEIKEVKMFTCGDSAGIDLQMARFPFRNITITFERPVM